ncbi:MAG: DUF2283 domain-containing protein [Bacteroidales bacterium]|nr:DUF2283 domain-containing protein [Bacteroidales bacterium]
MKVKYDKETDILYIRFSDAQISESDEEKKGLILDYDAEGNIAGIEIVNASERIIQPSKLEYEVA